MLFLIKRLNKVSWRITSYNNAVTIQNRFEPAIQFVLEAKQATFMLAEGNGEKNRDFLKKSVRTFK
jgi:hypothetical protein